MSLLLIQLKIFMIKIKNCFNAFITNIRNLKKKTKSKRIILKFLNYVYYYSKASNMYLLLATIIFKIF